MEDPRKKKRKKRRQESENPRNKYFFSYIVLEYIYDVYIVILSLLLQSPPLSLAVVPRSTRSPSITKFVVTTMEMYLLSRM